MRTVGRVRRGWRVVAVVALALYITAPWTHVSHGAIELGLRTPHVRLVGWDVDEGPLGFDLCDTWECHSPGLYGFPFDPRRLDLQVLDPQVRHLADEYRTLNTVLRDAGAAPTRAGEFLGLSADAREISRRLARLRDSVRQLPLDGLLGRARVHYVLAIELTFVDASTHERIWNDARRGNPKELNDILDRALREWEAGDHAARTR